MKTITLRNTKVITLASLAAVGLAATLGAVAGETAADVPALTVRYADLNLNTPAGVAVLYKRIHNAAGRVCGDTGSRQWSEAAAAQACVKQAVSTSVRFVNNPLLTNEYRNHFGEVRKPIDMASLR